MFKFLCLPNELKVEILEYLDHISLIRCSMVCKVLNVLVNTSSDLQYCIELALNGMERVSSSRPHLDLVTELRRRRQEWDNLNWSGPTKINVSGRCKAYELVGGVFAKTSGRDMYYVHLPSATKEMWTYHNTDLGIPIRDFAMDPSMDLLVVLEENNLYSSSPNQHEVRIHFRSINENKAHPRAKLPLIRVVLPPDDVIGNAVDSATLFLHDDVFALLINFGAMLRVILWNWTSGTMLYDSCTDPANPSLPMFSTDFCLVDRDSFLVLNTLGPGSISLYRFSPTAFEGSTLVVTLLLPPISPQHLVSNLTIHSGQFEGNPSKRDYVTNHSTRIHVICLQHRRRFEGRDTTIMFSLFVPNDYLLQHLSTGPTSAPRSVPWEEWGPHNTRLMGRNVPVHWLRRYVHGRMVACELRGGNMKFLDFSSKPPTESSLATTHTSQVATVIKSSEETRTRSPFLNAVKTYLPYRSLLRQEFTQTSDYMIDEDRIIGIELASDMVSMVLHVYTI
ncbi:hypothetical protein CVT24_012693 [Panaeolus cyanescens]|uniref:F-box domain-containing protein n=1 Tax=Panaeolus cyanescens TaxID=181874 RepID=A0A409YLF5_9AGAR|nr:hypothetical protein CVT24_012693 [Panaeolus cyanescens]